MFIGIDPDLHNTGIAVVDENGQVVGVECCSIHPKLKGHEAAIAMMRAISGSVSSIRDVIGERSVFRCVVEAQHITFKTANPTNILHLGYVAGGAAAIVNEHLFCAILLQTAAQWKGQTPKEISQKRILTRLGWAYTAKAGYAVPTDPPVGRMLGAGRWKHVVDAIGIALRAKDDWEKKYAMDEAVRRATTQG